MWSRKCGMELWRCGSVEVKFGNDNLEIKAANRQLPTTNCQPSTINEKAVGRC